MYLIGNNIFNSFNDVIDFAWNEYKLDLYEDNLSIEQQEEAVEELISLINNGAI